MLAAIYTLALGLISAAFVEIGLYTVFPEAEWELVYDHTMEQTPEEKEKYIQEQKRHHAASMRRDGIISCLSLVFATLMLAISLPTSSRFGVLSDGILLGGVFTLLYGVGVGIKSGGRIMRFAIATVSLIVALGLGYVKFVSH